MLLMVAFFVVLSLGPSAFNAMFVLLIIYSLVGRVEAIRALSLIVISKSLNPAIYSFSPETAALSWFALLVVSIRFIVPLKDKKQLSDILPLGLFFIFVLILTVLYSVRQDISLFKLFAFSIESASIIIGFRSLTINERNSLISWFGAIILVVALLSIPTLYFPNIAYNRNGLGFQGILGHPQLFGALLAPYSCWLLAGVLFKRASSRYLLLTMFMIFVAFIYMSQTRTSGVAIILTVLTLLLISYLKGKSLRVMAGFKVMSVLVTLVLLVISLAMVFPSIENKFSRYIYKRDSVTIDQALSSRSGGIQSQWENFLSRPWVGYGFGVYPSGVFPEGITYYEGIPISAPVEKGFLPTALLEETGVFGGIVFLIFLVHLVRMSLDSRDIQLVAVCLACVYVNVGELVIFSPGGIGLFYWLLIGLTIVPLRNNSESARSSNKLVSNKSSS